MCFKRKKIQPRTSESSLPRRRSSNIDQVTTKLKGSVILLIVLGTTSLGFSLFVVLFDVAFNQPHIWYSILCLTGCPWELFIYFMFFRKQTEPSKNKFAAGTSGKDTYKTGEVVSNSYVKTNRTICTLEDEISHARRNSKTTDTSDTQGNSTTFTLEDEISHARSNSTAMSTIEDRSTSN